MPDELSKDVTNKQIALPGSHRIRAAAAEALQPADAGLEMSVTVKLRRKAPLPEINAQQPQILTAQELAQRYGASQEDMDLAARTFEQHGLTVTGTDLASCSLSLSGTVGDVEAAFGTKLFSFKAAGEFKMAGAMPRVRSGDLYIPAALAGIVEGVFGLDQRPVVRERQPLRMPPEEAARAARRHVGLFAAQLAQLYDFPPGDGSGQTVALLEFGGGYFEKDLAHFCKLAQIPLPTVQPVSIGNAAVNLKDGQEGEVMLDIEVAASACPKAAITVYFSRFDEQGWVDALDRAVRDQPTVISVSWGLAEDDPQWSQGAIGTINDALHQAALLGITVCVASGDDGSSDQITDGRAHTDFPASSPFALAVGGTSFTITRNAIADEAAWKQGDGLRADGGGSSGGGVSQVFARPAWQTVSVPSVNPHPLDGRIVPDIAALAGAPYYSAVIDGKAGVEGGTSAATPLWACLICRIAASLPAGKKLPFLAPLLYPQAGRAGAGTTSCRDIVSGDNITAQAGGYRAQPGFDAVTGWGTPNGAALLAALLPLLP